MNRSSSLAVETKGGGGVAAAPESHPSDRRAAVRLPLRSAAFPARTPSATYQIRFKDISSGGACGLICEPIQIGDYVVIEFDRTHQVEAQVCWVRRFMIGLKFSNPLNEGFIERLRDRPPITELG